MTTTPTKPVRLPAPPKLEADDYGIFVETPLGSHVLSMGIEYRDLGPEVARRWNVHEALVEALRDMVDNCLTCDGDGIVGNFEHGVTWDEPCPRCTDARDLLKAEADHAD